MLLASTGSAQSLVYPIKRPEGVQTAAAYYARGRALYRRGQFAGVIEDLYTATNLREDYPQAQLLLARVLVQAERSREAVSTLRGLALPYRTSPKALKLFGWAYYRLNWVNDAEEVVQASGQAAGRPDAEVHCLLGLIRLRQQDATDAMRQAERALAIRPHYALAYRLLSDAYLLQGKEKLARRCLQQQLAHSRDPQTAREIRQRLRMLQSMN
ncbi:MAG: tetratricopeptide repeat protein, partial [Blastocatellia bacterium]|nr:tetratricopeptide repeat protein [Blastocatellia bacterium]